MFDTHTVYANQVASATCNSYVISPMTDRNMITASDSAQNVRVTQCPDVIISMASAY